MIYVFIIITKSRQIISKLTIKFIIRRFNYTKDSKHYLCVNIRVRDVIDSKPD